MAKETKYRNTPVAFFEVPKQPGVSIQEKIAYSIELAFDAFIKDKGARHEIPPYVFDAWKVLHVLSEIGSRASTASLPPRLAGPKRCSPALQSLIPSHAGGQHPTWLLPPCVLGRQGIFLPGGLGGWHCKTHIVPTEIRTRIIQGTGIHGRN